MRSEKEVYDIVLTFAKTDKRIRMVTLEGSKIGRASCRERV